MNRLPLSRPRRILGVGIATLDIINEVASYPAEDEKVRALGQRRCRGGNATNTLVVLSQLGHACAWAGTLADDAQSEEILRDLKANRVDTGPCVRHAASHTPTSYVTLSRASGSRTIVHHRDLPELGTAELAAIDLAEYDWVHFEGRNPPETAIMIGDCLARRPDLEISLEVEKPRPGIERLFRGPKTLLFSRAYARSCGYRDPESFLAAQWPRTGAKLLVLPWGADGAFAQVRDGPLMFAPPYVPRRITDTLAAGDVFNAAVIDGLLADLDLPMVLGRATRLAGYKCSFHGLDGLVIRAREAGLL